MTEIKLYDYWDDWGWMYYGIGMGNLSASVIVPLIEAAKDDDITVRINSCGGLVFDGWAIYNALINHPKNVIIQIDGIAASIASIIAMAGKQVIACKGSMLMIHKPTTQVWMYDSMDADDLQKEADALNKIQAVLNSIYVAKTGLDSEIVDTMINEETWLTPDEALALNFITSINEGKNVSITQNAFDQVFNSAPARVKAYANRNFNILNIEKMSKDNSKLLKENKTLLTRVSNFFKDLIKVENSESTLKDGTQIFYEGELAIGTAVYSDAEMTSPLSDGDHELEDGRTITVADGAVTAIADAEADDADNGEENNDDKIKNLEDRITALEAENSELATALETSNSLLEKISNVKSKGEPKERKQDFGKGKEKKDEEDFSESLKNRREEIRKKKAGEKD